MGTIAERDFYDKVGDFSASFLKVILNDYEQCENDLDLEAFWAITTQELEGALREAFELGKAI